MHSSVLLLSSDPLFSHIVIKILIRHDISVVHTSSFGEALHAVDRFRAMILDLDLKIFGGIDLVRSFRSESQLPLLVMAEVDDPQLRAEALKAGAQDAMAKAYLPDELVARVRSLLRNPIGRPSVPAHFAFQRHFDPLDAGLASRR